MRLTHKIKSYFKTRDFHSWKELRLDDGLCFVNPTEEILVEIASCLRELPSCETLEDDRYRMKQKNAVVFNGINDLVPWLSRILHADFEETSEESAVYAWEFRYQFMPHRASDGSFCISNMLTSKRKPNSNCIYSLVSIRKFSGKYYCWTF